MTRLTTRPVLPRIVRVIAVEPFAITVLWTTTEIRRIDFTRLFDQWKHDNDARLYPLFDYEVFSQVTVSPARTLHWPAIPIRIELAKRVIEGPLDLDPDELYRQSELVQKTEKLTIGRQLRQAREAAGLSQTEVALKSGTSRNYISRIENDKSDIQLETLNKIVQLGIGKQVHIEID